jgi:hypothetical protein
MDIMQFLKNTLGKTRQYRNSNFIRKEVNMSTKSSFKVFLAVGLLLVVLLSALVVFTVSAPAANSENSVNDLPANYYVGSDWIERHPNNDVPVNYFTFATPTPVPANYYTGSDWIERHPCQPTP